MTRRIIIAVVVVIGVAVLTYCVSAQRAKLKPNGGASGKQKPEEIIAPEGYKPPEWCDEAPSGVECMTGHGSASGGGWQSKGFYDIKRPDGSIYYVITCDDWTGKPKGCYQPPKPHPETFSECMARRYSAYESTWYQYLMPSGLGTSRGYTDVEKNEFIRSIAAMDEKGKAECNGKALVSSMQHFKRFRSEGSTTSLGARELVDSANTHRS